MFYIFKLSTDAYSLLFMFGEALFGQRIKAQDEPYRASIKLIRLGEYVVQLLRSFLISRL